MGNDAAEQDDAAGDMDHEIAEPGPDRRPATLREDQIGGSERHALPEQVEGQVVTGKHHAKRAADIDECRHVLAGIRQMQRVDHADQRHDGENGGEDDAELVHLCDQDLLPDEPRFAIAARLHRKHDKDRQRRDQKQIGFADRPAEERDR